MTPAMTEFNEIRMATGGMLSVKPSDTVIMGRVSGSLVISFDIMPFSAKELLA